MGARKPYVIVVIIQLIYTGMYVISKAAFIEGLSTFVFVFYRQLAATILLVPVAIVLERKRAPPISSWLLLKVFMNALLGITLSLNLYNLGLRYTSATVGSAISNSIPVITFFLALLLRTETLKLKRITGMAKMLGIVLCLAGTVTIAFYSGPRLSPLAHFHLFGHGTSHHQQTTSHPETSWIKGTFLMITANVAWSLWLAVQGFMLKEYPSKLLLTTLQCLFSTVQSFLVAMAVERETSQWKLRLDTGLLAIGYCGFVVTGVSFYLQTWCIEKRGPVFLAMSNPLALVFTIFCSSFFLGELVHLGSVIGGLLMVGGLYSVLWAKSKESATCQSSIEDPKQCIEEKDIASEIASPFHPI